MDQKNEIETKTEELLMRWGAWARANGLKIGFPTETPFRKLQGSAVSGAMLDDSTALQIDAIMSELSKVCPEAKEVAELYYAANIDLRDMAIFKIKYAKAREMRKVAISFLMGRLYEHVSQ